MHDFRELLRLLNYLLLIMLQKIRSEICSLTITMLAMLRRDVFHSAAPAQCQSLLPNAGLALLGWRAWLAFALLRLLPLPSV